MPSHIPIHTYREVVLDSEANHSDIQVKVHCTSDLRLIYKPGLVFHTYYNFPSIPFKYITEKLSSGQLMQTVEVHSQIFCPMLVTGTVCDMCNKQS
jgi:hypothetical protein